MKLSDLSRVIYDLDGTIIDTERFHQDAWELTSQEYGFGLSGEELYLASKGISSKKTLEKMLPEFELPVGICTSAWKEMYKEGKPAAEPLLITSRMIGVDVKTVLYVGDALADYQCAQNAGAHFVYFCGENATPDEKVPSSVQRIKDHRELIGLLE